MRKNCIHYEASNKPLGEETKAFSDDMVCRVISAGHMKHEYTTGYAYPKIREQFGF